MKDMLTIGNIYLENRLFTGTGKFPSKSIIRGVLSPLGKVVVTVALRRVDLDSEEENILLLEQGVWEKKLTQKAATLQRKK